MEASSLALVGEELNKKISTLKEVGRAEWIIYYTDDTGTKWYKHWPNSQYHGGGAPELREIHQFPWET